MPETVVWKAVDSFKLNYTDSKLTISRPCPICGSCNSAAFFQLPDFQFYSDSERLPKRVNISQTFCSECNCIYMNPCYSKLGFDILFKEAGASYGAPVWRYEDRVAWLLSNIEFKEGMTILDLGCHDGFMLSRLPKYVKKIGVDINHNVLKKAKERHPDITFICSDIDKLSFKSGIDLITIFHVLEHVQEPTLLLKK